MSKRYLVGAPGAGKTTRLIGRLVELLNRNTRPDRILVLAPQSAQAKAFRAALSQVSGAHKPRGEPDIGTIYGLAQQHVSLFFPLIAESAGFADSTREPVLINVEAAQYFLDRIVAPRAADFDDLKLFRPRLLSQILDSMNKAAECGFGLDEIALRLGAAWPGEPRRLVTYQRAQEVAVEFRQFCLRHSLLDFSLLVDTFAQRLLPAKSYQDYIAARYRHLLADNLEENPPVMHDFLSVLLTTCDSALLAEDDPGGYRLFLGADPASARALRAQCDEIVALDQTFVAAQPVVAFGRALMASFEPDGGQKTPGGVLGDTIRHAPGDAPGDAIGDMPGAGKYWTEMVDWTVERIGRLVASGVAPSDIAVLAPYVEDVLRFELEDRLRRQGIGVRAVRPSRPLYDHPTVRACVMLAKLAHPHWQLSVSGSELARALSASIAGLDVARAQLIADAALKVSPFELPVLEDQALWQRVGMRFHARYAALQGWMAAIRSQSTEHRTQSTEHRAQSTEHRTQNTEHRAQNTDDGAWHTAIPLDLFWQQLFTEVLSQPGFGLNDNGEDVMACDKLIRSARAFREIFERSDVQASALSIQHSGPGVPGLVDKPLSETIADIGLEYVNMLALGIMAAQYAPEREQAPGTEQAVLLAPVYTYLTSDFRSRVQFWLDINALGWYARIYQPLTHPYVLSRRWSTGETWAEEDEHREQRTMLRRVIGGLVYRCSGQLYLASSQLGISGQEESGPLARAVQRVLARSGASVGLMLDTPQ